MRLQSETQETQSLTTTMIVTLGEPGAVAQSAMSLDDALSHVGFGRFQAFLMAAVGVGYCSDTVRAGVLLVMWMSIV